MHGWTLLGKLSRMERKKMDYNCFELQKYEDENQRYLKFKKMAFH
jgi:hypothetical protein